MPRKSRVPDLETTASRFEVSARTPRGYLARGWDGDPETLDNWRRENLRRGGRRKKDQLGPAPAIGADDPLEKQKLYFEVEQKREAAEKLRLENEQTRAELISREEAREMFIERIVALKQSLWRLKRPLARALKGKSDSAIEAELEASFRKLLEQFSKDDERIGGKKRRRKVAR